MILNQQDLPIVRNAHPGQKIVLAGGGFDLLHVGHLDYLEFCKGRVTF